MVNVVFTSYTLTGEVSSKHILCNTNDDSNAMLIVLLVSHPLKISVTLKDSWEFSGGLCTCFLYSLCPNPITEGFLCGWLDWRWLLNSRLSMERMESSFTISPAIVC